MFKVCAGPVKHRHEIVAYRMYALCGKIAKALLIILDKIIAVRSAIFDAFAYRKALNHRPAHSITLNVFAKVAYPFTGPYFSVRHIVKGCDDALNTDLAQHVQGYAVLAAEPPPGLFHIYDYLNIKVLSTQIDVSGLSDSNFRKMACLPVRSAAAGILTLRSVGT